MTRRDTLLIAGHGDLRYGWGTIYRDLKGKDALSLELAQKLREHERAFVSGHLAASSRRTFKERAQTFVKDKGWFNDPDIRDSNDLRNYLLTKGAEGTNDLLSLRVVESVAANIRKTREELEPIDERHLRISKEEGVRRQFNNCVGALEAIASKSPEKLGVRYMQDGDINETNVIDVEPGRRL